MVQEVLFAAYRGYDRFDAARFARPPSLVMIERTSLLGAAARRRKRRRTWSPVLGWLFGFAWRRASHYRNRAFRRREVLVGLSDSAVFAGVDEMQSAEQRLSELERFE